MKLESGRLGLSDFHAALPLNLMAAMPSAPHSSYETRVCLHSSGNKHYESLPRTES
jgi:hypothetical protein